MTDTTTPTPFGSFGFTAGPNGELGVLKALSQVALDIGPIGKDSKNEQQGFTYRGIETIVAKAGPLLAAHHIVPTPRIVTRYPTEIILVGKYEKPWRLVTLEIEYTFRHADGSAVQGSTIGEGFDPGDKAANKCMSAAWKYMLLQMLLIAAGHEESDGDRAADPSGRRESFDDAAPAQNGSATSRTVAKKAPAKKAPAAKRPAPPAPEGRSEIDPDTGEVKEPAQESLTPGSVERAEITEILDGIRDKEYRTESKTAFVEMFGGPPAKVPLDKLDAALAFAVDIRDGEPF